VFQHGELGLVDGGRRVKTDINDPIVRNQWHAMLAWIANERDYKPGWIAHQYKQKFGTFPAWGAVVTPIRPTPEVRSWVKSRMIAFVKGRHVA
jgi:DNA repair protein RadD